jgi:hypothetical protein
MSGLATTMPKRRWRSKRVGHGQFACAHDTRARIPPTGLGQHRCSLFGTALRRKWQQQCRRLARRATMKATGPARRARIVRAGLAVGESDSVLFSFAIVNERARAVESAALSVDGLAVPLRGFRKSHHLIPAGGSGQLKLKFQLSAMRHASAYWPAACVRTIVSETSKGKVETACPSSKALLIPGIILSR